MTEMRWLSGERTEEFERYQETTKNPFDILNSRSLDDLCFVLTDANAFQEQPGLFSSEDDLVSTIEMLRDMQAQRVPLYSRFQKEMNGKLRSFAVPKPILSYFFDTYLIPLTKRSPLHEIAHGGEQGWSPEASVSLHLPVSSVLAFDLASAFNNVPFQSIYGFFYDAIHPDISGKEREQVAGFLARMSTVPSADRRVIPQGSSHSCVLFNRVLHPLDVALASESEIRGYKITRWIDDITISSQSYASIEEMLGAVALTSQVLPVSPTKIFYQTSDNSIFLLGQRIDQGVNMKHNNPEERETNKVHPIDYAQWFKRSLNYKPWI